MNECFVRQTSTTVKRQQLAHPDYSRFRQTFPIIGIWDDHDYGINDGDNHYQYRKESQQLFLDFLDEPKNSPRRHQEGIYTSYTYGSGVTSVKFILLDNRYHRDPYGTEFGDFLGQAQWTWLEHELMTSTATFNIVAAGIQVLPDDRWHKIGESWSKFPKARARLLSLIQSSRASGVILLSGDVHFAEINQVRCGDAYNLTEISSSGMTHAWKLMRGVIGPAFTLANMILPWHFRVDPHQYYGSYNFGDVAFDWSKSPPTAAASVYGKDGLLKLQQVVQADRYSGDGPVACGPIHAVYPTYFLFLRVFVVAVILAFIASVLVNAIVLVVVPLQLVWRLFAFLRHPKLKSS
ncbi:hypothetical protein, variant 1 [Aphanomyces invadans]|uniref:PhoD-like phosphatase metallophosphatase domain-containing protein n=1 Tax=Aphanomyces invadans TaxID=157072 RepID=A0A024TBC4_9STRA|nr:hypothetical protein, variant 1 [Aphanomyces invadans]ETV91430.1 hypothetical protein, variant 1 [Aphanomyces invadans]|eukprot:XP_008879882.1 hypothetical protein, variant 1 [Aphanomyces invadans]